MRRVDSRSIASYDSREQSPMPEITGKLRVDLDHGTVRIVFIA